ncbi:MAG: 2Fe-2S iron-sulfur cluster-binding protein, partial [Bacilli bacterium]
MYSFKVNNKEIQESRDISLLKYLREELKLTGTKDGCSEGACGTCTILVDGNKTKACLMTTAKVNGKEVTTIEGLSDREKEVYAYAFGETGAVQCGFCIPGMVISSKSLLDANNNPSLDDVKKALVGNICRCTGYVKIEEAILLAAKMFRENLPIPSIKVEGKLGERLHRIDAVEKILGTGQYVDDVVV